MKSSEIVTRLPRIVHDLGMVKKINVHDAVREHALDVPVVSEIRARNHIHLIYAIDDLVGGEKTKERRVVENVATLGRAISEAGWQDTLGGKFAVVKKTRETVRDVVKDAVTSPDPLVESQVHALRRLSPIVPRHNVFLRRKLTKLIGVA